VSVPTGFGSVQSAKGSVSHIYLYSLHASVVFLFVTKALKWKFVYRII